MGQMQSNYKDANDIPSNYLEIHVESNYKVQNKHFLTTSMTTRRSTRNKVWCDVLILPNVRNRSEEEEDGIEFLSKRIEFSISDKESIIQLENFDKEYLLSLSFCNMYLPFSTNSTLKGNDDNNDEEENDEFMYIPIKSEPSIFEIDNDANGRSSGCVYIHPTFSIDDELTNDNNNDNDDDENVLDGMTIPMIEAEMFSDDDNADDSTTVALKEVGVSEEKEKNQEEEMSMDQVEEVIKNDNDDRKDHHREEKKKDEKHSRSDNVQIAPGTVVIDDKKVGRKTERKEVIVNDHVQADSEKFTDDEVGGIQEQEGADNEQTVMEEGEIGMKEVVVNDNLQSDDDETVIVDDNVDEVEIQEEEMVFITGSTATKDDQKSLESGTNQNDNDAKVLTPSLPPNHDDKKKTKMMNMNPTTSTTTSSSSSYSSSYHPIQPTTTSTSATTTRTTTIDPAFVVLQEALEKETMILNRTLHILEGFGLILILMHVYTSMKIIHRRNNKTKIEEEEEGECLSTSTSGSRWEECKSMITSLELFQSLSRHYQKLKDVIMSNYIITTCSKQKSWKEEVISFISSYESIGSLRFNNLRQWWNSSHKIRTISDVCEMFVRMKNYVLISVDQTFHFVGDVVDWLHLLLKRDRSRNGDDDDDDTGKAVATTVVTDDMVKKEEEEDPMLLGNRKCVVEESGVEHVKEEEKMDELKSIPKRDHDGDDSSELCESPIDNLNDDSMMNLDLNRSTVISKFNVSLRPVSTMESEKEDVYECSSATSTVEPCIEEDKEGIEGIETMEEVDTDNITSALAETHQTEEEQVDTLILETSPLEKELDLNSTMETLSAVLPSDSIHHFANEGTCDTVAANDTKDKDGVSEILNTTKEGYFDDDKKDSLNSRSDTAKEGESESPFQPKVLFHSLSSNKYNVDGTEQIVPMSSTFKLVLAQSRQKAEEKPAQDQGSYTGGQSKVMPEKCEGHVLHPKKDNLSNLPFQKKSTSHSEEKENVSYYEVNIAKGGADAKNLEGESTLISPPLSPCSKLQRALTERKQGTNPKTRVMSPRFEQKKRNDNFSQLMNKWGGTKKSPKSRILPPKPLSPEEEKLKAKRGNHVISPTALNKRRSPEYVKQRFKSAKGDEDLSFLSDILG